jgi:hypothetical protein
MTGADITTIVTGATTITATAVVDGTVKLARLSVINLARGRRV